METYHIRISEYEYHVLGATRDELEVFAEGQLVTFLQGDREELKKWQINLSVRKDALSGKYNAHCRAFRKSQPEDY